MRALKATDIAGILDQRNVHTQADTQEGNIVLARVLHRSNLALYAPIAEAARDQNGVHAV